MRRRFDVAAGVLVIAVAVSSAASTQGAPLFRFVEKPGPHAVGLKVVEQYDYTRTFRPATDSLGKPYQGNRARPLQTLIWYPAERGGAKSMTVGDYVNLWATELNFAEPKLSAEAKQWRAGMSPTLEMPLWARHDAPPARGRFPVVIYAPSLSSTSWENADLCEYLASHGYLVLAAPNMGEMSRAMTKDVAGINAQARDISFLIGHAHSLPNADTSKVAVVGFSWGGLSGLFAAARDSRISALVALDGSMRYFPGLVKAAGDVHPEHMTIPLMYFAEGNWSLEHQARYIDEQHGDGPNVLNAWTRADLITVRMLGMTHQEYSSMHQRNEDVWKDVGNWQDADYGREDGMIAFGWVARYTLEFLNGFLKRDASAMEYLKRAPTENGVPRHFMAIAHRPASGVPATLEGFRRELGRLGFAYAGEIFAALQKEDPGFKLDQQVLEAWSEELVSDGHLPEAIALRKLQLRIYPESGAAAYVSLGDAYARVGQKRLAIDYYRKSLEKEPANEAAKEKLRELERIASGMD